MAAVRVPPSAWITSQSTKIVRGPMRSRSTVIRKARPIRRWISCVRPPTRPRVDSRGLRVCVERGSMAYSAVIQPCSVRCRWGGWVSSTLAAHSTRVLPTSIRADPSAWSR